MGLIHKQYLEGGRIFTCSACGTHLSSKDDIVSRARATRTHARPRALG
jgi:hypothetical protein